MSRLLSLPPRAVLLFAVVLPGTSQAGTVITQKVETHIDQSKSTTTHVWSIDQQKFHLTVQGDRGESTYIFNGRNFYVCSRPDAKQLELLKKNNLKSPELLAKLKAGACQAVPSNFMARFFLSPVAAVESIDQSDGLKLTLTLTGYQFNVDQKGAGKSDGQNCVPATRHYVLTKRDVSNQGLNQETNVSEELCLLESLSWRDGMWKELAKTVMRQPKGQELLAQLKNDHGRLKGFILANKGKLGLKGTGLKNEEKNAMGSVMIKTMSIKEQELSPKLFQLPIGYNVFSPESLTLVAEDLKKENKDAAPSASGNGSGDLLDSVQSVFFCAISGGLGCFRF